MPFLLGLSRIARREIEVINSLCDKVDKQEKFMFRFIRTTTAKSAAEIPAALQFAAKVTSYVNKQHSLNMKFGVELFGAPSVHWYFDTDSLDKSVQVNAALLQDREFCEMLDKSKALWTDGSTKDTIVSLAA